MEQSLIEDLVIESIKIYGIDAWYIPRTLVAKDDILNEDDLSTFNEAYMAEMYIKSVDGFEGEGDFLSKFGLEIRDSVTMTIARRTYDSEVGSYRTSNTRPLEGDLIFLPLNNKVFEIQHVEHESIFYQMGSLQMYDLRAELFEYSGERFRTGQKFIDELYKNFDTFVPTYEVQVYDGYEFVIRDNSSSDITFTSQALELKKDVEYTFDQSHVSNQFSKLDFFENGTTTQAQTVVRNSERYPGTPQTGTAYEPGYAGSVVKFTPNATGTYQYKSLNNVHLNKLLYTSDINAGITADIWETQAVTVTATNQLSPRETTDAVTLQFSLGAPVEAYFRQTASSSPNPDGVINSIYVKNASAGLKLQAVDGSNNNVIKEVDIPTGASWQRVGVFATGPDQATLFTATQVMFRITPINNTVARNITVWGAMTEFNARARTTIQPYQEVTDQWTASGQMTSGKNATVIDGQIDTLADNKAFEDFGNTDIGSDNIIDFSNSNPFGEDSF